MDCRPYPTRWTHLNRYVPGISDDLPARRLTGLAAETAFPSWVGGAFAWHAGGADEPAAGASGFGAVSPWAGGVVIPALEAGGAVLSSVCAMAGSETGAGCRALLQGCYVPSLCGTSSNVFFAAALLFFGACPATVMSLGIFASLFAACLGCCCGAGCAPQSFILETALIVMSEFLQKPARVNARRSNRAFVSQRVHSFSHVCGECNAGCRDRSR